MTVSGIQSFPSPLSLAVTTFLSFHCIINSIPCPPHISSLFSFCPLFSILHCCRETTAILQLFYKQMVTLMQQRCHTFHDNIITKAIVTWLSRCSFTSVYIKVIGVPIVTISQYPKFDAKFYRLVFYVLSDS